MFTNKTFNNQNGITADNITTNTILSSAGATILSTTAADSSINLKITTNAVTSNAVYYDLANDKLSYGAVSSGGGSILATANTFTNTNTFNGATILNGANITLNTFRLAYAGNIVYYDTVSKKLSYSDNLFSKTFVNLGVGAGDAINNVPLFGGNNAIAIGYYAAREIQHHNTTVLNATGASLNTIANGSFYVAPIRPNVGTNVLYYNDTTKEITYGAGGGGGSGDVVASGNNTFSGTNNFTGAVNNSGAVRFTNASNSISIGSGTNTTDNVANSIVLNATVNALSPATVNACYINPIRNVATNNNILNYNPTTKEVTYQQKGYLYYTTTTAQSIPNGAEATTLFNTTNSARNVAINGLTFNSATGLFTNSSGSTLNLSISYGVGFNETSTVGYRAIWIRHSAIGYVCFYQISATAGGSTVICTSGVFSLLNGETFECRCYQNSGGPLTIVNTVAYPTVIHICQQ